MLTAISPTAVPIKPYPRVYRVTVMLTDIRNYPLATAKIPEMVITDLSELITGAQAVDPLVTPEAVVRAIWRHGSTVVWRNLRRGVQVSIKDLPQPRPLQR